MSTGPKALTRRTKGRSRTAPPVGHGAPDLSLAVWSLADGIQKTMVALYALQTALVNAPAYALVEGLKNNRQVFRTEWDRDVAFLQNCYNYASEYISLCEILAGETANSEVLAMFYDMCALARKVYDEAGQMKLRHQKMYDELKRSGSKVSTVLSDAAKVSNSGANHRCNVPPDASAFVQAAHASLHPDGNASLLDSYSALDQIGIALADLVAFWKDHVNELISMSPKRGSARPLAQELRASEGRWKSVQPALLSAISSISASSDAVTVNATGPRKVPDHPIRAKTYDSHLNPIIHCYEAPAAGGLRLFQRVLAFFGYP